MYKVGNIVGQYGFRKWVKSRSPSGRRSVSLVWQQKHLGAYIDSLTSGSQTLPLSQPANYNHFFDSHNGSTHLSYMSANFSILQATTACSVYRQMVVNDVQLFVNNMQLVVNDAQLVVYNAQSIIKNAEWVVNNA